ncbi:isochorismatase [Rhodomicrobium udaipurense JA643]|uniref:Isochorismatase family protein n=1 Tax=Rhodomicrobium udaipurense TaxID=1202716 RepID=A0A8I1KKZ6_9HYPH|nr:isochorismatase family protein [Rhodomicrobium udaipurense]KAI94357.1 isochorismatase [Rhodomicrobium udaipurense JA643]MBJ7544719.1 isochorismatase family protein [Rhodomicrobium udaipurense]
MPTLAPENSLLLAIDFQPRLMAVIEDAATVVGHAKKLRAVAALLGVPTIFTEQYAKGLGTTVEDLAPMDAFQKMTFDACGTPGFLDLLGKGKDIVVAGCEAHICVLQTVLSLLDAGQRVFVVRDAIGSRRAESKETAVRRMERHGAEIVTVEMVVFEWLQTAEHPRFREAAALIK